MRIFVTGSTGYIGQKLVQQLVKNGHEIVALYRSETKKKLLYLKNVIPVKGDILDYASLVKAMDKCDQVYHVASFAGVWTNNTYSVYKTIVLGSLNVIRAAQMCNINRIVITSTAGVLGPSKDDIVTNENVPDPGDFYSDYESAKFILENVIRTRNNMKPEIILVNPTRVYGPGQLSESNGVTKMIIRYVQGKWTVVPGNGLSVGNYTFIDDVVTGHILAMEHGTPGERYILGGESVSFNTLFAKLRKVSMVHGKNLHIPLIFAIPVARLMLFLANTFGIKPLIVPGLIKKFTTNWIVSSEKAEKELNYKITPLEEGLAKTIDWIGNPV